MELSADELALYDRQLRVWGAEGQNRIKNASILMIRLNGVGNEIVKNLVLCGVGAIEIWDDSVVCEDDLTAQFFLAEQDLGVLKLDAIKDRVKDMNPRVELRTNTAAVDLGPHSEPQLAQYLQQFDLVITNEVLGPQLFRINEIARSVQKPVFSTKSCGFYACYATDLITDLTSFSKTKSPVGRKVGPLNKNQEIVKVDVVFDKENDRHMENFIVKSSFIKFDEFSGSKKLAGLTRRQKKRLSPLVPVFLSLLENEELSKDSLALKSAEIARSLDISAPPETVIDTFFTNIGVEIVAISAMLGGIVSQDVINYLSKKELVSNNFLIVDGDQGVIPIYQL